MNIDFGDISKSIEVINHNWEEFRQNLLIKLFAYDDIDTAKSCTFLKVFNDIFENCGRELLALDINSMNSDTFVLCRATKLSNSESNVDYERLLPKAEFIKDDNRFSPEGFEYLYLSIGSEKMDTSNCFNSLEQSCLTEIRVQKNDYIALCQFEFSNNQLPLKVIDLTFENNKSYSDINNELTRYVDEETKKLTRLARVGIIKKPNIDKGRIEKWAVSTYSKLISSELFRPLDGVEKKYEYLPFQCLAQYFMNKGFDGIIYKSTICEGEKNIVLFNKYFAVPIGKIREEKIIV